MYTMARETAVIAYASVNLSDMPKVIICSFMAVLRSFKSWSGFLKISFFMVEWRSFEKKKGEAYDLAIRDYGTKRAGVPSQA